MTHTIHHGDCLDVLRAMPDNSVDAVVCDPPYGLSNTSPDKVTETIVRWAQGDREYVPTGKGFMSQTWDAFVPPVAVWDECLRVLKPGGHLVAFAGSRTQDLMGLAIRLAGFDLRDSIAWINGAGFPKSLDISKAIDKMGGNPLAFREFAKAYSEAVKASEFTHTDIDRHLGIKSSSCYWARDDHRGGMPPRHHWEQVRDLMDLDAGFERLYDEAERAVIGTRNVPKGHAFAGATYGGDSSNKEYSDTSAASEAAKRWSGWGTSLKPAVEPVIVARKPISEGTVAANTLTWGTGGLNIDATRIGTTGESLARNNKPGDNGWKNSSGGANTAAIREAQGLPPQGRWPANVVLDPDTAKALDLQSGNRPGFKSQNDHKETRSNYFGADKHPGERQGYNDEGGASRFFKVVEPDTDFREDLKSRTPRRSESNFDVATGRPLGPARLMERHVVEPDPPFLYAAKAPKRERPSYVTEDGQTVQHATVKPLSIMQWLVRLVTPAGGTVLDPFAGSGTTVEAAILEGFHVVGIEREAAYLPLIQQRIDRATPTGPEPADDLLGLLDGAA